VAEVSRKAAGSTWKVGWDMLGRVGPRGSTGLAGLGGGVIRRDERGEAVRDGLNSAVSLCRSAAAGMNNARCGAGHDGNKVDHQC
jgi:hypothetical protein